MSIAADHLIEVARERLREFGIDLEIESPKRRAQHVDAIATLSRAGASARYAVLVKELTLTSVVRVAAPRPPILSWSSVAG
ncbi:hypothetical protein RB614_00350 [Phytohabitans sp. ZYX-F-186]|uniref:Uncharacterized protein n=1 Tax=Phytohabitans maris TaxID=3071409 RepID=A0ABU0Z7D6_9ACTN|nr:hypothetical protein [Phytohabitans sp. ZYX-F-186]MDQ7902968.1 hypothetical protein [Phytohabitans sp. ZYX-F-186]